MGDDFRVTVGGKAMAAPLELGLALAIIEEFAVVDDEDAVIFVADGLAAIV